MRFTKMHGIGNDYVYVNGFEQQVPDPAGLARKISDRHFGVGADGMILILPSDKADARMRMFNADGSEAEMCGNGVRCVAKYVYDHRISQKPTLRIETGNGVLTLDCQLQRGKVSAVRVNMGAPILEAARIPVQLPVDDLDRVINVSMDHFIRLAEHSTWREACKLDGRMTCVSMGNPHLVLYCGNVAAVPLENIGPLLERAPIFPRRINVHFVQVHSRSEVTMRTWERGSGITLACGTGACAVCVAGVLTGRTDRQLLAHLPGGDLQLHWREEDDCVYMTGPASEVFEGEWSEAQAIEEAEKKL